MLEQEGIFNDISPKLRETLEARINSFGKIVRYKFNLARTNPDPSKYNGDIIFPSQYNLHPVQWKITDNDETEERLKSGKQKVKNIGVIEKAERDEKGNLQYRFIGIRVTDIDRGVKMFNMDNEEDRTMVASFELHPKNGSGLFPNPQMVSIFSRIDDKKFATEKRAERSARKIALDLVEVMSDKDVIDFADGMAVDEWNSTQDLDILRNKIGEYAESNPASFNEIVSSDKLKYCSTIKKAISNGILTHNVSEGSIAWTATGLQIISLGVSSGSKNDIERFAEWFLESGGKAEVAYKKIKSLIEKPVTV